jgi:hypothetical protein
MAPQEVAGLQALAKAHGGTLTVNPDTGLPEAGFLSNILPMVIGAGITAATGGAAAPWMIGLGVGGAQALATGSLQKGLMAGLGAYGGAGLAGGLMSAGAAGAAGTGAAMGPQTAAQMGSGFEASMAAQGVTPAMGASSASMGPMTAGQLGTGFQSGMAAQGVTPTAVSPFQPMPPPVQTVTQAPTFSQNMSQMGQGVQNLGTEAGRSAFMSKEGVGGGSGLLKYGYAAATPLLMQPPKPLAERPKDKPYEYTFDYGRAADPQADYTGAFTGERTYFNPVYTRTAADGGLMDTGPIQAMADRNQAEALRTNNGMYFAEGGETKAIKPVEQDPYYTMSGQSGDAFKYLMGQGQRPATAPAPAPVMAPAAATAAPVYEDRPGGTWENAPGDIKPYSFDPSTGAFTALPVPKVWKPFAQSTVSYDGGGAGIGTGGFDGGGGSVGYGGDYGAGFAAASASDFGGSDGGGYGGGGGDTSGGYGGDAGYGAANGGLMQQRMAMGGISALARGGQSHLGDYSDGGRLLKGPGDGVSDSIPATIADKRPARLADGEFVVPARIVSELGNGSTEAGARKLYAMMDRVQKARSKTVGKDRVAVNSRAEKLLPA